MSEEHNVDFDMQAAWLRRFNSDAESNLKAFALRLKEALPHQVSILESKSFFSNVPHHQSYGSDREGGI